jgi:hypothetical protein
MLETVRGNRKCDRYVVRVTEGRQQVREAAERSAVKSFRWLLPREMRRCYPATVVHHRKMLCDFGTLVIRARHCFANRITCFKLDDGCHVYVCALATPLKKTAPSRFFELSNRLRRSGQYAVRFPSWMISYGTRCGNGS